jgi:hypothetical protein
MNSKTVGLVVLEHVTAVDVTGPAEAFAQTKIGTWNQSAGAEFFRRCYRVLILVLAQEHALQSVASS